MNYLDLCSEVVSRSHEPLCYIQRWISQKLLEIETRFQKTTHRKLPTGIKWSRDQWRHLTLKSQTRDPNTLRAQYLENSWRQIPFQWTTNSKWPMALDCRLWMVLRPHQHSISYIGDGFYRSKDPTNSIKVLKESYKGKPRKIKQQNTHTNTK